MANPTSKHQTDNVEIMDEKPHTQHHEESVLGDGTETPQRTSCLVNLSKWEAIKTCKRVGIMMDGYQVTVPGESRWSDGMVVWVIAADAPGNLVANPGFIEQFGTFISERTGVNAIDPVHITLWAAAVSSMPDPFNTARSSLTPFQAQISAVAIQPLVGFVNDKFGRRAILWQMTVFLVAVRQISSRGGPAPGLTDRAGSFCRDVCEGVVHLADRANPYGLRPGLGAGRPAHRESSSLPGRA
jgi:hypothetical protein